MEPTGEGSSVAQPHLARQDLKTLVRETSGGPKLTKVKHLCILQCLDKQGTVCVLRHPLSDVSFRLGVFFSPVMACCLCKCVTSALRSRILVTWGNCEKHFQL